MDVYVDLSKVTRITEFVCDDSEERQEFSKFLEEAKNLAEFYDWCRKIEEMYVGMFYPGIIGIFLFKILPAWEEVDEWVWVIVGDLPPAYLTCEECPNPATALDGYIGAMETWVSAVEKGTSVENLIPVYVPENLENAKRLKSRLQFLDERILANYKDDLKA